MGRELEEKWDRVQGRDSRVCKMIKMINYMFWAEQVGVDSYEKIVIILFYEYGCMSPMWLFYSGRRLVIRDV